MLGEFLLLFESLLRLAFINNAGLIFFAIFGLVSFITTVLFLCATFIERKKFKYNKEALKSLKPEERVHFICKLTGFSPFTYFFGFLFTLFYIALTIINEFDFIIFISLPLLFIVAILLFFICLIFYYPCKFDEIEREGKNEDL